MHVTIAIGEKRGSYCRVFTAQWERQAHKHTIGTQHSEAQGRGASPESKDDALTVSSVRFAFRTVRGDAEPWFLSSCFLLNHSVKRCH